jgi:hypothetical protein
MITLAVPRSAELDRPCRENAVLTDDGFVACEATRTAGQCPLEATPVQVGRRTVGRSAPWTPPCVMPWRAVVLCFEELQEAIGTSPPVAVPGDVGLDVLRVWDSGDLRRVAEWWLAQTEAYSEQVLRPLAERTGFVVLHRMSPGLPGQHRTPEFVVMPARFAASVHAQRWLQIGRWFLFCADHVDHVGLSSQSQGI